ATAAITKILDEAVAKVVPFRRKYDAAAPGTTAYSDNLIYYWTFVGIGAQRVYDALERARFICSGSPLLDGNVVDGMRATWTRSGEALQLDGLCRGAPALCPAAHAALHAPTGSTGTLAAHFTKLDARRIRTVEIAGLFGVDLRGKDAKVRPD